MSEIAHVLGIDGRGAAETELDELLRELRGAQGRVSAERGYEGFTISAMCEAAGVAPRFLHDRVDGKDDLFLAVYEHGVARVRAGQSELERAERWAGLSPDDLVRGAIGEVGAWVVRVAYGADFSALGLDDDRFDQHLQELGVRYLLRWRSGPSLCRLAASYDEATAGRAAYTACMADVVDVADVAVRTGLPGAPADEPAPPLLERVWADGFPELSRPVSPLRTPQPRLLALNEEVARELGLDPDHLRSAGGVRFLTGESLRAGSAPVAQVYAGHQWGVFMPILGDGRAALLGERRDRSGRLRDVHLKGIGPTSMSRVDGFAVVGPMLRELLMGEAMHALGVPTTRAIAVVATGAPRHHDGRVLPGAVLARTAASHVRFGSFEYVRAQDDPALLRRLADHVIGRHYPRAAAAEHPYRALLGEVVDAVASLTADWMRTGFVHGVISTDNVAVSAETIDYGPCAFLDAYVPGAYFSSLDRLGRYAYDQQPSIMRWNLERLGHALAPLLADDRSAGERVAEELVAAFDARYQARWAAAFRDKLGFDHRVDASVAAELAHAALDLLADHAVDFTGFWRDLAAAADGDERPVRGRFLGPVAELDAWLIRWSALAPDAGLIRATNPVYIARNHIVEEALLAATEGDLEPFDRLLDLLRDPCTERSGSEYRRYARPAPDGTPRHRTFCGT